jgi:hypothetical protein
MRLTCVYRPYFNGPRTSTSNSLSVVSNRPATTIQISKMNIEDILKQIDKSAQPDNDAFDLALASHGGSRNAFCDTRTHY